jgi:hypothetical protein
MRDSVSRAPRADFDRRQSLLSLGDACVMQRQ